MHCLRLFIVVLQELHCLLQCLLWVFGVFMCLPNFILIGSCVSELHAPIVMYCLRLFSVVLQELHSLPHVFIIRVIACYQVIKFRYSTPSGF